MKFIIAVLLTTLLSFISGLYMPWWGIAIAAFIVSALIPQGRGRAFLAGFLGVFILWGSLSIWIDSKNNGILSHKIAQILPLSGSVFSLILLTAFIGALVGGLGSLTASFLRMGMQKVETEDAD
jgi:hypothetical protein